MTDRPLVVLAPEPRRTEQIFAADVWADLAARFEVVDLTGAHQHLDDHLPHAFAVVGQPDLPADRLANAPQLRAILNVEGNFLPNVDYPACFARGIRVLGCGPAFACPSPSTPSAWRSIWRAESPVRTGHSATGASGTWTTATPIPSC